MADKVVRAIKKLGKVLTALVELVLKLSTLIAVIKMVVETSIR